MRMRPRRVSFRSMLSICPTHHRKLHHKVKRFTTKRVRRHDHIVRVNTCKMVWVYS